MKINADDGFNPELAENAKFSPIYEMPVIYPPKEIIIPKALIPFSKRKHTNSFSEFIHFYEYDWKYGDFVRNPKKYIEDIKKYPGAIGSDCSLYTDSPLPIQIANTYRNRLIEHFLQENGIYVIPNVRWGEGQSFRNTLFMNKFAFDGLPKNSILSVGTYGCIQGKENRQIFKEGLESMLDELNPKVVLVYGRMPDNIFTEFKHRTQFINYPDWISEKKRTGSHKPMQNMLNSI